MNSRERVLMTINHKEPDQVPIYFGGTSSSFTDRAYFKMKKYLGIEEDIEPYRKGHTGNYHDPRLLKAFDVDVRFVLFKEPNYGVQQFVDDTTVIDEWGISIKQHGEYASRVSPPLYGADLMQIKRYKFPEPREYTFSGQLQDQAKELFENTDKAVVARSPQACSFLEIGSWLRGTEDFLMDLVSDDPCGDEILDKILETQLAYYSEFLDKVGKYVHIVETSEDFGTQSSCLVSPKLFRKKLKPCRQEINRLIKGKCPNAKILHHSCGAIYDIIPDLIDSGVDILNPIQPTAVGMDSNRLKKEFGKDICFCGGFDMINAINGSLEDVKNEVVRCMDELKQGGGYLFATSNHIQSDTPEENIIQMFQNARAYGKYWENEI